ncbi:MAG: hypothetical protein WC635_02200 [Bacteriovorax sp.]|jgi:hypothetical protein
MKKSVIFPASLLLTLSAFAEETKLPEIPTAKEINEAVSPIKGTCSPFYAGAPKISRRITDQVKKIKSQIECLPDRKRLANDVSFYVNTAYKSATTIGGNWQPGFLSTGEVTDLYVGMSAFRDLMFVTKVKDGNNVIGYNVTLSYCEMPNAYPDFPALVSNDRALVNFSASAGISLSSFSKCGYGSIDSAMNTTIVSKKSEKDENTLDFPVYTSFSSISCGL